MSDYQPGDLDRMRFAVYEACDISTAGVVKRSGIPWVRAKAALVELARRGLVTFSEGHRHGDSDICHCADGEARGLPKLTHWYTERPKAVKA